MNKKILCVLIFLCLFLFSAPMIFAQDDSEVLTLRTITVDWYQYSGAGVKIQYRSYDSTPRFLYLPISFDRKLYRFVEAPKGKGDFAGLPVLLVHMRGSTIEFIDIYTRYMMSGGKIAEFDQKDIENFAEVEKRGTILLTFN